jgi:imidazolonepropionase-like amidohydrolase
MREGKMRKLLLLKRWILFSAVFILLFSGCSKQGADDAESGSSAITAFVNVTVIPMDSEQVLEDHTVLVRGGLIESVQPSGKIKVPKGTRVIDGAGKYLMPGLADMHVHMWSEGDFVLFLANGVTTVRNMWGSPQHLQWKRQIAAGELLAPSIITAGPLMDGPPPIWDGSYLIKTPDEARKAVAEQKKAGYDFIKVYNQLSLEAYDAIIEAAREHDIPVAGHVPYAVGPEHVIESRQDSIEHLEGYRELLEADDSPVRGEFSQANKLRRWNYIDREKIPAAVEATREAGTWNCVTIVVYQLLCTPEEAMERMKWPEMKYVDPLTKASWDPTQDFRLNDLTTEDFNNVSKAIGILTELTGELHKGGARILLGTDTPNPFVVPGFSIHTELQHLVAAGLTPYEAIRAGTHDAAEFAGQLDTWGIIATGRRADLLLLEANPLDDVANAAKRAGIMLRGQWFTEEELHGMLEDLAASYTAEKDRFADMPLIPTEGESLFAGTYQMNFGEALLGEERISVQRTEAGENVVFAQSVMDAPYNEKAFMRLAYDDSGQCRLLKYEKETSSGTSSYEMMYTNGSLKVTGTLLTGDAVGAEEEMSPDMVMSGPLMSSLIPATLKFRSLAIGETKEIRSKTLIDMPSFNISDDTLTITRKDDEEYEVTEETVSVRVYNVDVVTETGGQKVIFRLDGDGQLVTMDISMQMGTISFKRVE